MLTYAEMRTGEVPGYAVRWMCRPGAARSLAVQTQAREVVMATEFVRGAGWAARGSCRGADPELFFPDAPFPDQEARAKAICATCPVIAECRAYAVRAGESEGIWGGLTTAERRRLRFPRGWRQRAAS